MDRSRCRELVSYLFVMSEAMSRTTGRRGEPERAIKAALYLAHGFSIRKSLRLAGYSWGVANRGTAALRHSQLLQSAIRLVLARSLREKSLQKLQAKLLGLLYDSVVTGRSRRWLCRMASAFKSMDLKSLTTEYYGRQRWGKMRLFICALQ